MDVKKAMRSAGDYSGDFRGKVLNNIDPSGEGQLGIWIPDLQPLTDGSSNKPVQRPIKDTYDLLENDEDFKSGVNKIHTTNSYLWYRPAGNSDGTFSIPRVGTWVTVYFENEDPSKGFYRNGVPTANGEVIPATNIGKSNILPNVEGNWASPAARVNIAILKELDNGNIMFFDGNANSNAFCIRFTNGHEFTIRDAAQGGIRLSTAKGHIIEMDENSGEIRMSTQSKQVSVVMRDTDGSHNTEQTGAVQRKAKSITETITDTVDITAGTSITLKAAKINLN